MANAAVIIHGKRISDHSPRAGRCDHDLWGVTRCNAKFWNSTLTDWTEWFDLHPLVESAGFEGIQERRPEGWHWMVRQDGTRPIWLQAPKYHQGDRVEAKRRFDRVPGATEFPMRDLQDLFPVNGDPDTNFGCQAAQMIAFALMRGYTRIVLNGIGEQHSLGSQHAHRSTLYWIAFARGRGVEVVVEGKSTYRQPATVYAYARGVFTPEPVIDPEYRSPIYTLPQRMHRMGMPKPRRAT
jgi:hypothetical protein